MALLLCFFGLLLRFAMAQDASILDKRDVSAENSCGNFVYIPRKLNQHDQQVEIKAKDPSKVLKLTFSYFNTRYCSEECRCDKVTLEDVFLSGRKQKSAVFCGFKKPWSVITKTYKVLLTVYIAAAEARSYGRTGVSLLYCMVSKADNPHPSVSPVILAQNQGEATINKANVTIKNKKIYQLNIRASEELQIELRWEVTTSCSEPAVLELFDGPSDEHRSIQKAIINDSNTNNGTVQTNGFHLFIKARVPRGCNQFIINVKFSSSLRNFADSNGFLGIPDIISHSSTGDFTAVGHPGSPMPYFQWKSFKADEEERSHIYMEFREFIFRSHNEKNCFLEGFVFWDGTVTNGAKYGPFCGADSHHKFFQKRKDTGKYTKIISSLGQLNLLFYSYVKYEAILSKVSIDLWISRCLGIFNWSDLKYHNINGKVLKKKNVTEITIAKLTRCIQIQKLPTMKPVEDLVNVKSSDSRVVETLSKSKGLKINGCTTEVNYRTQKAMVDLTYHVSCPFVPFGFLFRIKSTLACDSMDDATVNDGKNIEVFVTGGSDCGDMLVNADPSGSRSVTIQAPTSVTEEKKLKSFSVRITCPPSKACLKDNVTVTISYITENEPTVHIKRLPASFQLPVTRRQKPSFTLTGITDMFKLEYEYNNDLEGVEFNENQLTSSENKGIEFHAKGSTYLVNKCPSASWNDIERYCKDMNYTMVTVNSYEELNAIKSALAHSKDTAQLHMIGLKVSYKQCYKAR